MRNRTQLALGILLILLGGWLVATKQVPPLQAWLTQNFVWPMWVIGAGAIILIVGLLVGAPGMAVPACIVAGIGGILYYQNATHDFSSWSYMWTLIPGFVGVGSILAGLLGENSRHNFNQGINALVVSAVLFLIFATVFGGLNLLGGYGLAIILILLGVYIVARGLIRK
jgi:hypothetical protein